MKTNSLHIEEQSDNKIVNRLLKAIQINTVFPDFTIENNNANSFLDFHNYLEINFPSVYQCLKVTRINKYSLVYEWKGTDTGLDPTLFISHIDTVPVNDGVEWSHHPFGEIANGKIWGRGTMDVKSSLTAMMEAIKKLIKSNFTPRRTLYFAFGHDEETGGYQGAVKIAEDFRKKEQKFHCIFDEGGAIANNPILSKNKTPVAFIGIAEKGIANIKISFQGEGGHSSFAIKDNPISIISKTLQAIPDYLVPKNIPEPVIEMCLKLTQKPRYLNLVTKLLINIVPSLIKRFLLKNQVTRPLISTTFISTSINSKNAYNQAPVYAEAIINCRIIHGHSSNQILDFIKSKAAHPNLKIELIEKNNEPSTTSLSESEAFQLLEKLIINQGLAEYAAPLIAIGITDSRHYSDLTESIFRFVPIYLTPENASGVHGINEHLSIDNYLKYVKFYEQLIKTI